MARREQPAIPGQLLDQLLAGADPKAAFAKDGLLDELKKAFAERALNAGMDHHLGGDGRGDSRIGYGRKAVPTDTGRIELEVPRDRQATFDPQLIAKYQRRFPGGACPRAGKARPGGRQGRLDVRARDEHPRDPGPPARRPSACGLRRGLSRGRG